MTQDNQETRPPALSLEKRRITATIIKKTDTIIYVQLPEAVLQRSHAKIDSGHLLKKIDTYHEKQSIDIFITKPVKNEDMWFASEDWYNLDCNPWFTSLPAINTVVTGTAEAYIDNYGVLVELDDPAKGISAFLHVSELKPDLIGTAHNIRDLIHIGDRIKAKIIASDVDRLDLRLSVAELLVEQKTTDKNIFQSYIHQGFSIKLPELATAVTNTDLEGLAVLVIDDNELYAKSLKELLELSGAKAYYACTEKTITQQLKGIKDKTQVVSHILLDFTIDNLSVKSYEAILRHIKESRIHCLLISGNVQRAHGFAQEQNLPFLAKHEAYINIVKWLKTGQLPDVDLTEKPNSHWRYSRRLTSLFQRAEQYLQALASEINADAALLVTQIRSGVFEIRANYRAIINSSRMEGELINSAITSALETKNYITRELHDRDPLKTFAPIISNFFLVVPFELAQEQPRILIFFRQHAFMDKAIKTVTDSLPELKHLIEVYGLTSYIEELEPFADIGRLTAGMLHEIRNEIAPIAAAAEKIKLTKQLGDKGLYADPQTLIENNWQNISISLERIAALAAGGLNSLHFQQPDFFELNERVAKICKYLEDDAPKSTLLIIFEPYPQAIHLYLQHHAIEQPLINVLQNAIYHCQDKAHPIIRVSIRYSTEPPFTINGIDYPLCIDVGDNGSGMNADQQASAFVPGKSSRDGGSGLGLYVSRNLLHTLGGELAIQETWRWLGSTFRLYIPMQIGE